MSWFDNLWNDFFKGVESAFNDSLEGLEDRFNEAKKGTESNLKDLCNSYIDLVKKEYGIVINNTKNDYKKAYKILIDKLNKAEKKEIIWQIEKDIDKLEDEKDDLLKEIEKNKNNTIRNIR